MGDGRTRRKAPPDTHARRREHAARRRAIRPVAGRRCASPENDGPPADTDEHVNPGAPDDAQPAPRPRTHARSSDETPPAASGLLWDEPSLPAEPPKPAPARRAARADHTGCGRCGGRPAAERPARHVVVVLPRLGRHRLRRRFRSDETLARRAEAYGAHPLLKSVSLDRSFYGPLSVADYLRYAQQVPDDFRFVVKAPASVTDAVIRGRRGEPSGPNPTFLDADLATREFVQPCVEPAGKPACSCSSSPLPDSLLARPAVLIDRLAAFFAALPRCRRKPTAPAMRSRFATRACSRRASSARSPRSACLLRRPARADARPAAPGGRARCSTATRRPADRALEPARRLRTNRRKRSTSRSTSSSTRIRPRARRLPNWRALCAGRAAGDHHDQQQGGRLRAAVVHRACSEIAAACAQWRNEAA